MKTIMDDTGKIADLKILLKDVLDIEEEFSDSAHFMTDLGLSSLMALEVMVALEKKYAVKFSEAEVKKLTSVENVFLALKEKDAKFN